MGLSENMNENPRDLPDSPYTQVGGGFRNNVEIINNLANDLESIGISSFEFQDFFNSFLENNSINDATIIAYKVNNNTISIYLSNGRNVSVSLTDYEQYQVKQVLGNENIGEIEEKVANLNAAIESIYAANNGYFWDGEINDDDVVADNTYGSELQGKTLSQLRELLEVENQKLYQVYSINRESDKKEQLLMLELKFFVGIGDKYEGGARYFALSTQEIKDKVQNLICHMSNREVFDFIEQVNASIEDNTKKSDMVNQVNLKLINQLYTQVFNRLISSEASNRDFIDFAKVVTGRGKLISERNGDYNYDDLEIDTAFKSIEFANKAMIHVMYRENGILENIQGEAANIFVKDDELDEKSPSEVMGFAIQELKEYAGYNNKTSEELITDLGFGELLGISKAYNELSFQEKVNLGGLMRIVKAAQDISQEDLAEDPLILKNQLIALVSESFKDLNASLSDNFNANWQDWNGTSAADLGLEGDLAEIFNLYQDVNGNWGIFHFSDASIDSYAPTLQGTLILGLGMLSAGICMGMLAAGAPVIAIIAAGAAAGAVTGLISQILGSQGYDTNVEAFWDTIGVMSTDAIIGAIFFIGSVKFFQKLFNINILAEKFFTKANFADMIGFGGAETLANSMITSTLISTYIKSLFPENHFETDVRALTEQLEALSQ